MQYIIKIPINKTDAILAKFPGTMKSIFYEYLSETPDAWNGWTVDRLVKVLKCDIEILQQEQLTKYIKTLNDLLTALEPVKTNAIVKTWTTLTDPWEEVE